MQETYSLLTISLNVVTFLKTLDKNVFTFKNNLLKTRADASILTTTLVPTTSKDEIRF